MVWNIDADPVDADWIKVLRWDLPTDVDEFLSVVGPGLEHFLTLPAARAMPDDLRAALIQRGVIDPRALPPSGLPVSESILMEHPGNHNQKVHGRRGGGGMGPPMGPDTGDDDPAGVRGQMSMGLGGLRGEDAYEEQSTTGTLRLGNSDEERTMAYGDIVDVYENGGGVTASFRVVVRDPEGREIATYAKPQEGLYNDELREGIPIGEEQERELAAHALSQMMGGNYVPVAPAILRTGVPSVSGVNEGDYSDFTTDASSRWVLVAPATAPPSWRGLSIAAREERLAVWDSLIANTDRHGGNVAYVGGTEVPIDHSLAFPRFDDGYGGQAFQGRTYPLSRTSRTALKKIVDNQPEVTTQLRRVGLHDDAIAGVFYRAEHMLSTGKSIAGSSFGSETSWSGWAAGGGAGADSSWGSFGATPTIDSEW